MSTAPDALEEFALRLMVAFHTEPGAERERTVTRVLLALDVGRPGGVPWSPDLCSRIRTAIDRQNGEPK